MMVLKVRNKIYLITSLKNRQSISKTIKNNSYSEEDIYEQFSYPPKSVVYPNSSDMKKLSEIPEPVRRKRK